jgi:Tfp pilus assembly protein PilF
MENIKLLFQLYLRPASAMSEILDKGSWIFAAILVLVVSLAFFFSINSKLESAYHVPNFNEFFQPNYEMTHEDSPEFEAAYGNAETAYRKALSERPQIPIVGDVFYKFFSFSSRGFFQPLLSISIFYVPLVILLMCVFGAVGNFGVVLQRSYGELATCSLMAWAAAHLPFSLIGILLYQTEISPAILLSMWLASSVLFGVLMIFALRTVIGASYATATLIVCTGWLAFSAGMYVFTYISPWLFSPFLFFYAYMYFGGAISGGVRGAGSVFRQKQNFKRFLHSATVNPRDADAHVQLGLIYAQRKQDAKAFEHFNKAFEIDRTEVDANYELGKIARQKGDLQNALNHFSTVVEQNDKHALSEIWREIGVTYLQAGMLTEAENALEKFVERRPVDSEGLYYLGKVYKAKNEPDKAREMFAQAVESAKISPDYRRRNLKHWSKLAEKEI